MYKSTGKPTTAKFKQRLDRIRQCSETGLELADRWNPKGRNYRAKRELMQFFRWAEREADKLYAQLSR